MTTPVRRRAALWMGGAATLAAIASLGFAARDLRSLWWWTLAASVALLIGAGTLLYSSLRLRHRSQNAAESALEGVIEERDRLRLELRRHDQLEQQLLLAKQAAEAAVLAKGEFLATMSHEIRTPLNGIIPMLELIDSGHLDIDQRELLRTATASSMQLLRIVDDILDYSKLEADKLELEITTFNLRELLDGVAMLMHRAADDKRLRLSLEIDPSVRLSVRGDPIRLRQVLGNLISNAVKFTERGGIDIHVRRLGEAKSQHLLRFQVRDTGIGIAPEQQARLFRSFTQADASTTRLYGGTGLGLAICKRIIDLMGGRIGVDSEPGMGATFWFEIPLLKVVGDMAPAASQATSAPVLVISSDARVSQRLRTLLDGWGMQVTSVDTTQEALERVRSGPRTGGRFVLALADHDSLRYSARALHRASMRPEDFGQTRLVWLDGEHPLPDEIAGNADVIARQAADADIHALLFPRPPAAAPGSDARGALPPPPASSSGRVARILLVEDNPVNLLVAQKMLGVLGHTADTAANGELALASMARTRYDLVLMDCQMPVLDGYGATRRWRAMEAEIHARPLPIIAMTANAMAGDRERCLHAGMDDYLSKPVSREQLDACLARWLPLAGTQRPESRSPAASVASDAVESADATPAQTAPLPILDSEVLDELQDVAGAETARIIGLFLEDAPVLIGQLETAAATGDIERLRDAAHTLKSSSANVGAVALSNAARRIELAARTGTVERPAVMVALVIAENARARLALTGYAGRLAGAVRSAG